MSHPTRDTGVARWLFSAALVFALWAAAPRAAQAQSFWTGALNDQWGNQNNWDPVGVPAGGIVTFSTPNNTTVDLGADRTVTFLQIGSPEPFTLVNNTLAIGGGVLVSGNTGGSRHEIASNVAIGGATTWNVSPVAPLEVSGAIAGGGSIAKQSSGTLTLTGANTYTGGTTLSMGVLAIGNDNALGTGTLTIEDGTTLATEGGDRTVANAVTVSGDFDFGGPNSLTLTGPVDLGASDRRITRTGSANLNLNGVISGAGGLTLARTFSGNTRFRGSQANTYMGTTTVESGGLSLEMDPGVTAIPGDLVIESGGRVNVFQSEQIADSATVTVDGVLVVSADETLGVLQGSGSISFSFSPQTLTVQAGNFSGGLERAGPPLTPHTLRKTTAGTLVLSGNNNHTRTEILDGTLSISADNNLGVSSGGLTLNGGVLRATEPLTMSRPTTLASNGTLRVDSTLTHNGVISGSGSLEKVGRGTLILNGANTYSGDTIIDAGVLSLAESFLADSSDVLLDEAARLNLTHAATDTIDELILGGFSRAVGTHGAIGSGADFEWSQITGTGLLQVSTFSGLAGDYNADGAVDAADYTVWRDSVGLPAGELVNDPNPGVIGQAQYDTWAANYGQTAPSAITVPEPTGAVFLLVLVSTGLPSGHRTR